MLDYQHIKKLAADAGFDLCGLTPCGHMAQNEAWLRAWLGKGYQSSLTLSLIHIYTTATRSG